MKTLISNFNAGDHKAVSDREAESRERQFSTLHNITAAFGLVGGLLLMLTVVILTVIGWFIGGRNVFRYEEVLLFIASLILLMSGAHCLDKIDEARKKERENEISSRFS